MSDDTNLLLLATVKRWKGSAGAMSKLGRSTDYMNGVLRATMLGESIVEDTADVCVEGWKRMYVEGRWTLRELEDHLDAMLPVVYPAPSPQESPTT